MLRSVEMGLFNLVLPYESALPVLNALGNSGSVEFIDMNKDDP